MEKEKKDNNLPEKKETKPKMTNFLKMFNVKGLI